MDFSKLQFAILGGDARQTYLCRILKEKGYKVASFGVPEEDGEEDWKALAERSECLLLPLPLTRDGVHIWNDQSTTEAIRLDLLANYGKKIIFGGKVPGRFRQAAEENGSSVFDYFESEYLQVLNALPTAEGALFVAMRELSVTLDGCLASVVGYGRIGKILTDKLVLLGSRVEIYERKEEKHAEILLAHATPHFFFDIAGNNLLASISRDCRVIFNTVPEPIFTRDVLERLPAGCLFIDLASPPGGLDRVASKELGVKEIWATALPGKYAPESAASYLATEILSTLERLD